LGEDYSNNESFFWDKNMTQVIGSLLVSGALVILHIIFVANLLRKTNLLSPMIIHFVSSGVNLVVLLILKDIGIPLNLWLSISILTFGCASVLFLFGALYKSLSIRQLLITNMNGGRISLDLLDSNVTQASFSERAELLCKLGLVGRIGNGYAISEAGILLAQRIRTIRKILGITTNGLYGNNK